MTNPTIEHDIFLSDLVSIDNVYSSFIKGAARAMFVDAWVSNEEEIAERTKKPLPWGPGAELMNEAPETPLVALLEAARLLGELETANNASIYTLAVRAKMADNVDEIDVSDFGHYIAMQALGHGVGWFDDHAKFDLEIPHFEPRFQFTE